jgi:hypothetical protein
MLWMWAIAVKFFEDRAVKYDVCFSVRDQARLLPSRSIFQVSRCHIFCRAHKSAVEHLLSSVYEGQHIVRLWKAPRGELMDSDGRHLRQA